MYQCMIRENDLQFATDVAANKPATLHANFTLMQILIRSDEKTPLFLPFPNDLKPSVSGGVRVVC